MSPGYVNLTQKARRALVTAWQRRFALNPQFGDKPSTWIASEWPTNRGALTRPLYVTLAGPQELPPLVVGKFHEVLLSLFESCKIPVFQLRHFFHVMQSAYAPVDVKLICKGTRPCLAVNSRWKNKQVREAMNE